MNPIADAQRWLTDRRRTLLRLVQQIERDEASLPDQPAPDPEDRAAAREAAPVFAFLSEAERRELEEVEAALARIEAGTYGRCEICGQAIGRQRLQAIPEARYCIACSVRRQAAG